MNILKESAQHKKSESRIQSVSYRELLFLIDALQVFLLFDVCTAYKVKVLKIEIFAVCESVLIVNIFLKILLVVCLLID